MKNREKYKNELVDVIKMDGRICGFVKKHEVFLMIGKELESLCEMDCIACSIALNLWLDKEYEEPEVDWENVPVDTLVRVRNNKNDEWVLRYFKKFRINWFPQFATWADGKTSKTVDDFETEEWKYCELVEDEDNEE